MFPRHRSLVTRHRSSVSIPLSGLHGLQRDQGPRVSHGGGRAVSIPLSGLHGLQQERVRRAVVGMAKVVSIPLSSLHGLQRPERLRECGLTRIRCFHTAKRSSRSATREGKEGGYRYGKSCFHTAKQSSRFATFVEVRDPAPEILKVSIPLSSLHSLQRSLKI